jgi:hypothetical protein
MEILPEEEPEPDKNQFRVGKKHNNNSFINKTRDKIAKLISFKGGSASLEEEVADLIEEHDPEGMKVGSEERSILRNVFCLSEKCVNDVMVPRADIIAVEYKATLDELRNIIIDNEHTRIPVYKESLDSVVGFIHIKDLVQYLGNNLKKDFSMQGILRETLFVPPSMKVIDLLLKMQMKRVHLALVMDEYGGTDGLVTLEDLVEEIIGEIEDEHDEKEEHGEINALDGSSFEVSARMPVADLEKKLGISLASGDEAEDFDTLGGLIFYMLGYVPPKGEILKHKAGIEFEVLEANPRKVSKLLVRKVANK